MLIVRLTFGGHKVYKPYFFLTFVISPGKENISGVIYEIREKNMSDTIHHECGFALIRLLKPLDYYQKKYGSYLYGLNRLYILMEKQRNRGQDGAGVVGLKLDMEPGYKYMDRVRSCEQRTRYRMCSTGFTNRLHRRFSGRRMLFGQSRTFHLFPRFTWGIYVTRLSERII